MTACECSSPDHPNNDLECTYPKCPFGRWEAGEFLASDSIDVEPDAHGEASIDRGVRPLKQQQ